MVIKNLGSNQNLKDMDPKVKAFVRDSAPGEIQKGLLEFAQVQGGDPDGDGTGGSDKQIQLEIVPPQSPP